MTKGEGIIVVAPAPSPPPPEGLEIKIDPEYKTLTDPLSEEEFRELVESVRVNNQRIKGEVNPDGVILDGHHRYQACKEAGRPFRYDVVTHLKSREEEILYIIEVNARRRHMNAVQRMELALKGKPALEKLAKENEVLGGKQKKGFTNIGKPSRINTQEELARRAHVSKGTLNKFEQDRKAVEKNPTKKLDLFSYNGTYEHLLKDARKGKITPNRVHTLLKKNQEIADRKAEVAEKAKGFDLSEEEKCKLLNKDIRDLEEISKVIKDNSVDLIVTDPPYGNEYLYLYEGLAEFASRKLKPGGSLVFYHGQQLQQEIHKIFIKYEDTLTFWWPIVVDHSAGRAPKVPHKNVVVKCKKMMWFVKGTKRLTDSNVDDWIVAGVPDKNLHPWAQGQAEAAYLIDRLTVSEDSLVVDPFLGSGAFGIPPIKMGRYFIGIEIDKNTFEIARNYIISETSAALKEEEAGNPERT
jgi:ParB-like chromosome segregation protein Spo0J